MIHDTHEIHLAPYRLGALRQAWDVLASADAMGLMVTCSLHNVAMHLTLDGFGAPVRPNTERKAIAELGDRPSPQANGPEKSAALERAQGQKGTKTPQVTFASTQDLER